MQQSIQNIQKIEIITTVGSYFSKLVSPFSIDSQYYCASENGNIIKFNSKAQPQIVFTILGQPSSIIYNDNQSNFLIADYAHQSVFTRSSSQNEQINNLISQYSNRAFLGPSCLKIGQFSKNLYFTDSGYFQETSIESCTGSLFVYNFELESLKCLSYRNLAYPCAIEFDEDEKYILVCQMGQNRILKFCVQENTIGNYSIFYQFAGRFGPSSITNYNNNFYTSLFEFQELSSNGIIAVLNHCGQLVEKYLLPCGPEITGINIIQNSNHTNSNQLLITQGTKMFIIAIKQQQESKIGSVTALSQKNH